MSNTDIRKQLKKALRDIKCLQCEIKEVVANDIYVDGGSFDINTGVLTLTDTNGVTPDVTIDLSGLNKNIYDVDGSIPAATTRVATIADDSVLTFSAPTFGTILSLDGATGKVTIPGLLDPIGLQMADSITVNPGDIRTLWAKSDDSDRPYWGANRLAYFSDIPTPDGNGIYDGNGIVPSTTEATLTDSLNFIVSGTNGVSIGPSSFATGHALEVRAISANQNCVIQGFNSVSGNALSVRNSVSAIATVTNDGRVNLSTVSGHKVNIGTTVSSSAKLTVEGDGSGSGTDTVIFQNTNQRVHYLMNDDGQVATGIGQAAPTIIGTFGEWNRATGFTYGWGYYGNNQTTAVLNIQSIGTTPNGINIGYQGSPTGTAACIVTSSYQTTSSNNYGGHFRARNGSARSVGVFGEIVGGSSQSSSNLVAAVRGYAHGVEDDDQHGGYFLAEEDSASITYTDNDFIGVRGISKGTTNGSSSGVRSIGGIFEATNGIDSDIAILVPDTGNDGVVVLGADDISGTTMLQVTGEMELFGDGDGFYMYQPNGTRRKITLNNLATFVIT